MSKKSAIAYVDGSYNFSRGIMGSAVYLKIDTLKSPLHIAYKRDCKALKNYGSNIAEINAAKTAIKTAASLGVTRLTIYYDWSGIEFFSDKKILKSVIRYVVCFLHIRSL